MSKSPEEKVKDLLVKMQKIVLEVEKIADAEIEEHSISSFEFWKSVRSAMGDIHVRISVCKSEIVDQIKYITPMNDPPRSKNKMYK